jgi:hypothetical protein
MNSLSLKHFEFSVNSFAVTAPSLSFCMFVNTPVAY